MSSNLARVHALIGRVAAIETIIRAAELRQVEDSAEMSRVTAPMGAAEPRLWATFVNLRRFAVLQAPGAQMPVAKGQEVNA